MFPLFLKLEGRRCLLVGAGRVGEAKLQSLLRAGARVKVVAPRATAGVRRLAKAAEIVWRKRKFNARDLEGMFLVVAATASHSANARIFEQARRRGVLCNAVDDPGNCDFYYPAVVRRGRLQIAISTEGASPELASRLREELESYFGPEYGPWLDHLRGQREILLRTPMPVAQRQRLLRRLASRRTTVSSTPRQLVYRGLIYHLTRRALSATPETIIEQKRAARQEHAHGNQSSVPENTVWWLLAPQRRGRGRRSHPCRP